MRIRPALQRQAFRAAPKPLKHAQPRGHAMTDQTAITVTGASGRMGQMLVHAITAHPQAKLIGCIERTGHPWIGRDIGACMGGPDLGTLVTDDPLEAFARSQAVVDFTAPAATVEFAALAAQARAVHVVGTTGLEPAHHAKLDLAAHHAVIIQAGNMSLGVNLLTRLTQKVAQALDADWDIEIIEAHHNRKVDAPSGTALMLGEAAAQGRGISLNDHMDSGRDGITGARSRGNIGFSAIRGGDIVGEHDVLFAAAGERIVLRHIATDRAIFARGALKAALWGQSQKPGRYDMMDVLGL
jgi:4-hydroxy-tetrahydrodipicolinate reductase